MESAADVRSGHTPAKTYTDGEKRAALELAASIGLKPAAAQLGISNASIFRWRNEMTPYWHSLVTGDENARQHKIADNLEDLAAAYTEAEREAITQAYEKLEAGDLDAKELAALIKAMGSSRGVAAAGARNIRGSDQPNFTLNINFADLETAMERLLDSARPRQLPPHEAPETIDSTAEPA